jgi:hypothetical protein
MGAVSSGPVMRTARLGLRRGNRNSSERRFGQATETPNATVAIESNGQLIGSFNRERNQPRIDFCCEIASYIPEAVRCFGASKPLHWRRSVAVIALLDFGRGGVGVCTGLTTRGQREPSNVGFSNSPITTGVSSGCLRGFLMRHRIFVALCLGILLNSATALADNATISNPPVDRGARLSCFSIPPPLRSEGSCDQLCAMKNAACVGLKTNGAMNPGIGCEDSARPPGSGNYVANCRCCRFGK